MKLEDVIEVLDAHDISYERVGRGIVTYILGGLYGRTEIRLTFMEAYGGVEYRESREGAYYDSGGIDCDKELCEVLRIK